METPSKRRLPVLGIASIVVAGLIIWWIRHTPRDPRLLSRPDPTITYSNVLPVDYVGPQACAECHSKQFDLWSHHPHRRMNQLPDEKSVRGDFDDAVLELTRARIHFERRDGVYLMRVVKNGANFREYRVTRTVGSVYMQFYIGKQIQGPEPPESPLYREHMLPFCYWIELQQWYPKHYFDPDGAEELNDAGIPLVESVDHIRDVRPYNSVCLPCHNTYPFSYRLFSRRRTEFPGCVVATAIKPMSEALSTSIDVEPNLASFQSLRSRLNPEQHLVTLGISCESCHFGAREHVKFKKNIRFAPTSPLIKIKSKTKGHPFAGTRDDPKTIVAICSQCHCGAGRKFPNGAARTNSSEGLDLAGGNCSSRISCVDCHEPHTASTPGKLRHSTAHNEACQRCHQEYKDPMAAVAHSGHSDGTNVSCIDCHMPRYAQGLGRLVHSHRITSPVDESMISKGEPNACNLCHIDKSLNWTLSELKRGWNKTIVAQDSWSDVYGGSLDRPVGQSWRESKIAGRRLIARMCYSEPRFADKMLPHIIEGLNDEEPLNRVFSILAIKAATGRQIGRSEVDITAAPATRKKQIQALIESLLTTGDTPILKTPAEHQPRGELRRVFEPGRGLSSSRH